MSSHCASWQNTGLCRSVNLRGTGDFARVLRQGGQGHEKDGKEEPHAYR
jgi:hypothetical protein